MVEPSLGFIAERLERLQAEFRAFRHLSSDVAQLRADLLRVQENLSDLRLSHEALRECHDALRDYVLELRTRIDAGFAANDGQFRAIQAQFDQMARQMARRPTWRSSSVNCVASRRDCARVYLAQSP